MDLLVWSLDSVGGMPALPESVLLPLRRFHRFFWIVHHRHGTLRSPV